MIQQRSIQVEFKYNLWIVLSPFAVIYSLCLNLIFYEIFWSFHKGVQVVHNM